MPEEPIHQAAERGDVAALRRELDDGVSPNALSGRGRTPLHYLCSRGDNPEARVDCLHVLLEAGANVNAPNVHQNTPLHLAAVRGYANVVAALLEAGADVNRGDHSNFTPLHWACMRYDLHVEPALILLIRNGAAVNARTSQGRTPLDYAIIYRQRLVPILLRAGAALPAHTTNAYLQRVIAAGGFGRYERNHLDALAAMFAPHFSHLPPEIVRLVVEYAFHAGYY